MADSQEPQPAGAFIQTDLKFELQEHTEFAEAKLQERIFNRDLEDGEVDVLALVAVAGIAAEGLKYEEVTRRELGIGVIDDRV